MGKKGFYMNNELIEKIKAAKSAEEIIEIARKELSFEDTANVAGGTGRVEMTEAQAEHVVGGGHYVNLPNNEKVWISLIDAGYVYGTDPYYDGAYVLELMAIGGTPIAGLVEIAYDAFPVKLSNKTNDIEQALRTGGTAYLADCFRDLKPGYGF